MMHVNHPNQPATLTGLAIGDALGMPFETLHFTSSVLGSWDGDFMSGVSNEILSGLQPGQWTDDTKMAKALALSLVEAGGTYSPALAAAFYSDWYHSGDLRGIGGATRQAMDNILKGHHWLSSGVLGAEGNGTAMRIAPLGLFLRNQVPALVKAARLDACITHDSLEAQEGSVAVAAGVAYLANKMTKDELLGPVAYHLEGLDDKGQGTRVEAGLYRVHKFLIHHRDLNPKDVLKEILDIGTGARVAETVATAYLCFLTTDSFKDAVELAIRAGGDTDTRAAITGALAGTYYGTEQVEPYLEHLEEAELLQHLDHLLYLEAPNAPQE